VGWCLAGWCLVGCCLVAGGRAVPGCEVCWVAWAVADVVASAGAVQRLPGYTPRRGNGLIGFERVLARAGLAPVAGIDEAGRGACAGPLVVAAVTLNPRRRADPAGIADSKALTAAARVAAYEEGVARALPG